MWCVASAPIVPLARDLDAALGMPRGELAVHFRTRPTPSQAAPAFLHKVSHSAPHSPTPLSDGTRIFFVGCPATFSSPFSISSRPRIFSTRCTRRSYSLRAISAPSRTCATSRPTARHSLRMGTAAMGPVFRKHKKTSTVPWGAVLVLGTKRSTFGHVVLTCATMGGQTGGKRVQRRGLACATCAVDLIDAALYFSVAGTELVFAHLAVAIDAAHHFAGGLFHTAHGRLCGRGGRGRRRGGRARR